MLCRLRAFGGLGYFVMSTVFVCCIVMIAGLVLVVLGQFRGGMLLAGIKAQCKSDGGDQRKDFHRARKLARAARLPSVSLQSAKAASRGGGFVHDDLGEARQLR